MSDTPTPIDLQALITATVSDLYDTMLSMNVSLAEGSYISKQEGARLIGGVSFAGDVLGGIAIQVTEAFASIMTAEMLGMEPEEIEDEEEIRDVIRECCNIIAGNIKTAFADLGFTLMMSTPSLTTGSDFEIETRNMERYEKAVYRWGDHDIVVEMSIKTAETADSDARMQLKSIDINKFNRLDMITTVGDKVLELWDTMLEMDLEMTDKEVPVQSEDHRYMGVVSFAGDVTGGVHIQVHKTYARMVTAGLLGIQLGEVDDDEPIKDVVGEISNIVAGNLKTGFCDSGLTCVISTPSITLGTDFSVETVNMDRYESFAFQYLDYDVFVQVCVKIDESAAAQPVPEATDMVIDQDSVDQLLQAVGDGDGAAPAAAPPADSQTTATDTPTDAPEPAQAGAAAPAETAPSTAQTDTPATMASVDEKNLEMIMEIPLEVTVELGRSRMKITELLQLKPGATVPMENLEGEPLDIMVNECLVARGEVVVQKEKYGIRVTEIVSRMARIKSLF